jgi:hypothetical protein
MCSDIKHQLLPPLAVATMTAACTVRHIHQQQPSPCFNAFSMSTGINKHVLHCSCTIFHSMAPQRTQPQWRQLVLPLSACLKGLVHSEPLSTLQHCNHTRLQPAACFRSLAKWHLWQQLVPPFEMGTIYLSCNTPSVARPNTLPGGEGRGRGSTTQAQQSLNP